MSSANIPSVELLESVHMFPGVYQIRAIGSTEGGFTDRVLEVVRGELATPSEVDHAERFTEDGRHVSVKLDINVQNAEQIRTIYTRLHEVEGLRLLF